MNTLTKEERESLEDTYLANSPFYQSLTATDGDNIPYTIADVLARQHGTSVEALVAEGGLTLVTVPLAKPMVNTLDFVMALGY